MPREARKEGYSRRHRFSVQGSFGTVLRGSRKLRGRFAILHVAPGRPGLSRLGIALTALFMVLLPLIFAPLRALIGFKSDHHRSLLGWKRVPYIWFGTLLQFGGLAILPFALLVPVAGPVLDRFRHGRRNVLAFATGGRGLMTWVMAGKVAGLGLYPLALVVLVLSRAYGVARSAALPQLLLLPIAYPVYLPALQRDLDDARLRRLKADGFSDRVLAFLTGTTEGEAGLADAAAGVASNIEITQAQDSVATASDNYIAALYAHNLAKAMLARAVGTAEESVMTFLGGAK